MLSLRTTGPRWLLRQRHRAWMALLHQQHQVRGTLCHALEAGEGLALAATQGEGREVVGSDVVAGRACDVEIWVPQRRFVVVVGV